MMRAVKQRDILSTYATAVINEARRARDLAERPPADFAEDPALRDGAEQLLSNLLLAGEQLVLAWLGARRFARPRRLRAALDCLFDGEGLAATGGAARAYSGLVSQLAAREGWGSLPQDPARLRGALSRASGLGALARDLASRGGLETGSV